MRVLALFFVSFVTFTSGLVGVPGGLSEATRFSVYNTDPNQRKALQALYIAEWSGELGELGLHYIYPVSYSVQIADGLKYYITVVDELGDLFQIVLWVKPGTVVPVVVSVELIGSE